MFLLANAYQNLFRKIKLQVTPQRIQGFFLKVITETVEYREKNNIKRNDFLSMLIQLKNNGRLDGEREVGKISFNDLVAQSCKFDERKVSVDEFSKEKFSTLKVFFPHFLIVFIKISRLLPRWLRDIINSSLLCPL